MNKKLETLIVGVIALVLITFFGCSAMQDAITPCHIEPDAIEYSKEKPTSFVPFTTIWDAERVNYRVDYVHQLTQIACARMAEDDVLKVNFIKDKSTIHLAGAREFQETVFSPTGPVGLLVSGLGFGTLGALLIKRPGDKSKKEVDLEKSVPA